MRCTLVDLDIYRDWLETSLSTFRDDTAASSISLVIDGYDVVDKQEYPPASRLEAGRADSYDVVMLTGSSEPLLSRTGERNG